MCKSRQNGDAPACRMEKNSFCCNFFVFECKISDNFTSIHIMDVKKFKRLILPLQPALQQVAERFLGDSSEAEDAVQDLVVRLWEIRDRLDKVENIEAFSVTMLKRQCIDLLRNRHVTVPLDEAEMMSEETESVSQIEERYNYMMAQLRKLPLRQRKVVILKYVEGKDNQEIAEMLNMSMNNLYVTLSRAFQVLRCTNPENNN